MASLRKQPFFPHSINCTFSPLLISFSGLALSSHGQLGLCFLLLVARGVLIKSDWACLPSFPPPAIPLTHSVSRLHSTPSSSTTFETGDLQASTPAPCCLLIQISAEAAGSTATAGTPVALPCGAGGVGGNCVMFLEGMKSFLQCSTKLGRGKWP